MKDRNYSRRHNEALSFALIILIALILLSILSGCEDKREDPFEFYKYAVDEYVPDSLLDDQRKWVTETVRSTDQHLSAGDYEDPEDVIDECYWKSMRLFQVRGEGLTKKDCGECYPNFIPFERLTVYEKKIFFILKPK